MAEYKVFHCPYGDDFEGGEVCDRCDKYEICMETPTADVIERSKIDKAIEEIEDLDNAKYGFESYEQCKAEVLEILKRNIGE